MKLNSKTQAKRRFLLLAIGALLTFSFYGNVYANTAYTGMRNITGLQLTADMGTGWNLGNTLDAPCGETCWGNPTTTQAMIDKVKAQGFKTIRIPTTWGTHVGGSPNYTIDAAWLNRVETVCNYAFANDMYVILNTHHEGDWCKPTYADEAAVKAKLVAIWTQIANRFKNYGDYLIFETLNEPRLEGSAEEWTGGTAEGREVVNRLNKAAVDAIRTTGGNNSSRFIMCPPYAAAGLGAPADAFVVPNNDSKVIVSVHNYSPYSFCLQEPGTSTFTSTDRSTLDSEMGSYYNRWINAGRAVVIGEWGSIDKNNTSERTSHATYFVQAAKSRQLPVVLWDNGATGQYGFAQLNRTGLSWYFPTIVDAITSQFSGSCNPTAITPYIQVNGTWTQTSSVTVESGTTIQLGPQPVSGGSWSWSGMASGTSREVTIIPTSSGTATATYTNSSGCQSTQEFTITVSGGSTTSYVTITNRATGLLIDGMGKTSAGSTCGQYASSGSWNQMWTLETSGSYIFIKNRNTGLYLDGRGDNTNGSYVGQWSSSTSYNLQWQQETVGSYIKFKNRATGLYLDGMGRTTNGSDLGQWSSSTSNNQQWTITGLKSALVTTLSANGANEGSTKILLFPNPFTTEISIRIADPEEVKHIMVVDMLGKQVEVIDHADVKTEQVIGSSLKAGVYAVLIYSANSTQSFKILKK